MTRTNHLLASLPADVLDRLRPDLEEVALPFGATLEELGRPVRHVYFPHHGVVSMVMDLADGSVLEAATVGMEGMVGLPILLEAELAPMRGLIQVPGVAARIEADAFRLALGREPALRRLLLRYVLALIGLLARNTACHRVHPVIKRCARWLLATHDQMRQDSFPLTQEFLGLMLGVGRPSVSIAASALQRAGLISYVRGQVTVLDRRGLEAAACECYQAARLQYASLVCSAS